MTLPQFLLVLAAAYAGLFIGSSGGYAVFALLLPAADPASRAIIIQGLDRFIPAIVLALVGVALSRSAWARSWIWLPTLAGFVLGMGYHLIPLNVVAGLFRVDERIPMLAVSVGWLHWEARRLFAGGGRWIVSRPSRILIVAGRRLAIEITAECDAFVARCRDVDVASDGKSEREAVENLHEALTLYFERDETHL